MLFTVLLLIAFKLVSKFNAAFFRIAIYSFNCESDRLTGVISESKPVNSLSNFSFIFSPILALLISICMSSPIFSILSSIAFLKASDKLGSFESFSS